MTRAFVLLLLLLTGAKPALAQELRLAAPLEMAESGFFKHLLPRFKLKHRIAVAPVSPDAVADMALIAGGDTGTRVFARDGGAEYRLVVLTPGDATGKFADWLRSTPGKAAIESFPRGGPPAYVTDLPEEVVETAPEITGDAAPWLETGIAALRPLPCGRPA